MSRILAAPESILNIRRPRLSIKYKLLNNKPYIFAPGPSPKLKPGPEPKGCGCGH